MTASTPSPVNTLHRLRRLGLIVVTGKGGVGKTTVSAALGKRLAQLGAKVLLLEIDPRESAHRLLGLPPSSGAALEAEPGLWLQNLQPRSVVDSLVTEQVRIRMIARRVLDSPIYDHFVAGCPGLEELVLLGHAQRSLDPKRKGSTPFDLVILDAPATGHGLTLLAAPRLVSEVIEKGPFGRLAGDLATFVSNPERCGAVVVTHPEVLSVSETLEFSEELARDHGRRPELVVVNGLFPQPKDQGAAGGSPETIDPRWEQRWLAHRKSLERLDRSCNHQVLTLPLLPIDQGPRLAEELALVLGQDR